MQNPDLAELVLKPKAAHMSDCAGSRAPLAHFLQHLTPRDSAVRFCARAPDSPPDPPDTTARPISRKRVFA
eukprot:1906285-Rhodomonas_salina.2